MDDVPPASTKVEVDGEGRLNLIYHGYPEIDNKKQGAEDKFEDE